MFAVDRVWYDDCIERTWGDLPANGWKAGDSGFSIWEVCRGGWESGRVAEPASEFMSLAWALQKWLLELETELTDVPHGEPIKF